jgi:hypothetical protein
VTSVDLPLPDTPVIAVNVPQRHGEVDPAEVVLAGPLHDELLQVALAPLRRDRHDALATEVRPVIERGSPRTASSGPLAMISPPCSPAPGPDVDHPVRRPDRLLVVLDDEDRVAEVAEPGQRRDQLCVVALVETDRRLVEDVQGRPSASSRSGSRAGSAGPRRPDSVIDARSRVR